MTFLSNLLIGLVAFLHFYFLYLEMFLWTKPKGLKAFGNTLEKALLTEKLAANQGLYNGFLGAGLIWSLSEGNLELAFKCKIFFLICVLIAGFYGAYSVNKKIFLIQGLPAALALVSVFLS